MNRVQHLRAPALLAGAFIAAFLALGACGKGEGPRQQGAVEARGRAAPESALAAAPDTVGRPSPAPGDTTAAAAPGVRLSSSGGDLSAEAYVAEYDEAGAGVTWPSGCEGVSERVSDGPTDQALREFIYSCQRHAPGSQKLTLRVLRRAHTEDGRPPHPRFVVSLIEEQLAQLGAKPQRQRPLETAGIQGIEVQGVEPFGAGEVWLLGVLAGTDVYLLMAWDRAGGLFLDPEIETFFGSLRIF